VLLRGIDKKGHEVLVGWLCCCRNEKQKMIQKAIYAFPV